MRKKIRITVVMLALVASATAHGQNVVVTNSSSRPVPVSVQNADGITITANPGIPVITAADNATTQTAATGTNWTALASHSAKEVMILNQTGTQIDVRYGTGTAFPIPTGSVLALGVLSNSSELQIRRNDTSNTQVTLNWHYEN